METRHYATALRRWWVLIVVGAILGAALGYGLSKLVKPTYTATSQVYVSLAQGNSAGELANGANYNQQQMPSYAELATAPVVLDPVISALNLSTTSAQLAKAVSVSIPQGTTILQISVTDPSPKASADIANKVAESVSQAIVDVSPRTTTGIKNVTIRTIAPADVPLSQSAPKVPLNTALGLLVGLLLVLATVLLRARFDNRIRRRADLVALGDVPNLASVALADRSKNGAPLVLVDAPSSLAAESYRQLRSDLQYVAVDRRPAVVVVTSALPQEGKTTVACNLALALAEAGERVLLVDGDLRRPSVATYFDLEGAAGLSTILSGRATLDEVVHPWGDTSLCILPSGVVPPNPGELLTAPRMEALISEGASRYDVLLIDSPPALAIADASILGSMSAGVLVVVDATRTRRPQVLGAIQGLESAGVKILGTVLNKARQDRSANGYYSS